MLRILILLLRGKFLSIFYPSLYSLFHPSLFLFYYVLPVPCMYMLNRLYTFERPANSSPFPVSRRPLTSPLVVPVCPVRGRLCRRWLSISRPSWLVGLKFNPQTQTPYMIAKLIIMLGFEWYSCVLQKGFVHACMLHARNS